MKRSLTLANAILGPNIKFHHQEGWSAASIIDAMVNLGGIVIPLLRSLSLFPPTGTSTVNIIAL